MNSHISNLLEKQLYELIPSNLVVIDREYNIVKANKNFSDYFGEYTGRKCYEVYKKRSSPCRHCGAAEVFRTGEVIVSNEEGIDKNNRTCFYVVHLAPLKEENGEVNYIVEMSTDVTETTRYQHQYNILFERVPGFISVIDKNYNIIRVNKKLRDTFGEVNDKKCFEVYKKRGRKCKNCPAAQTFKDGKDHVSYETGKSDNGEDTQYFVNTTPLSMKGGKASLVIEIATDITELVQLHKEVRKLNDFFVTLIRHSYSAILAVNKYGKTEIFNPAAKELFNWESFKKPVSGQIEKMMPPEFFEESDGDGNIISGEIEVRDLHNELIPVRMKAVELRSKKDVLGRVAFMHDLRSIKELEKQKIDAERLAAVGQTVAGLAHTIKNMLMGLEGGMYMVDTGHRNGDADRIMEGWEVLQRNFSKTTTLVKDFLSFSKGRLPELTDVSPYKLAKNLIDLYSDAALRQNVHLTLDPSSKKVRHAHLDPDGMEACLTNFVSNAIDAATLNNISEGHVKIKVEDVDGYLIFEVEDNGVGIEPDIREKIFTTFFTTKGGNGTGLGLLTTRKIVTEHGGVIEFDTEPGEGSVFRIKLSREGLESIWKESCKNKKKK
ncbi:MAG: PAS domain-containing protein [Candidatus Kapabacteria bacterium]|jgi:PAS domain S-box-containing protein|nr:PAS domain-containing protein [Candidatus Kapabacteria bacterium]